MVTRRREMSGRRAGLLVVLAATLLTEGCGAVPAPDSTPAPSVGPEPPISAFPSIESTAQIRLPLDAYELTYDQTAALALAEARLAKACAARFGVDDDMPADHVLADALGPGTYDANKSPYGYYYFLNDIDVARTHGYVHVRGLPAAPTTTWTSPVIDDEYAWVVMNGLEPGARPPDLDRGPGQGTAVEGAYPTGVPRPVDDAGNALPQGGCGGEAVSVLAADGDLYDRAYAHDVGAESYFRALADSRVVAVTEAWSACMAGKAYDYEDPDGPFTDPAWFVVGADGTIDESRTPTAEEIATAVADIECKREVNYLGVRVAVESAYQQEIVEEHFQDLETNYRNAQAMLARANAVGGTS